MPGFFDALDSMKDVAAQIYAPIGAMGLRHFANFSVETALDGDADQVDARKNDFSEQCENVGIGNHNATYDLLSNLKVDFQTLLGQIVGETASDAISQIFVDACTGKDPDLIYLTSGAVPGLILNDFPATIVPVVSAGLAALPAPYGQFPANLLSDPAVSISSIIQRLTTE
jgi:hypothetical protein